jgi:hypothetical protein
MIRPHFNNKSWVLFNFFLQRLYGGEAFLVTLNWAHAHALLYFYIAHLWYRAKIFNSALNMRRAEHWDQFMNLLCIINFLESRTLPDVGKAYGRVSRYDNRVFLLFHVLCFFKLRLIF